MKKGIFCDLYIAEKENKLDRSKPIFWSNKLVKFVKWDSMNLGGKLKIRINTKFIEVDISELTN